MSVKFTREVLEPKDVKSLTPHSNLEMWLYRYRNDAGDTLCIATHGAPQSKKLSLGGFRIVPAARAATAGFSPEAEALGLGIGMEEKAHWSKLFQIAGPLGLPALHRVVGGKCVLLPRAQGRVGEKHDIEVLSWATDCLHDFEAFAGVNLVTGQDLGHGQLTNGQGSLEFLSSRFVGSVIVDTGKPTGEGNYQLTRGVMEGLGLRWEQAHIGVVGCGNIGEHIVGRLLRDKVMMTVLESSAEKRKGLSARGVTALPAEEKTRFLGLPLDALAVNALGGTLDTATVQLISKNPQTKLISGCENLVMPNPTDSEIFRKARKVYCHTELCGMMGYLTAVECYLAKQQQTPFTVDMMYSSAEKLRSVGASVTRVMISDGFSRSFEDTATSLYKKPNSAAA